MYKIICLSFLFLSLSLSAQAKEFITSFDDSTYKHAGVSFGLGAFADTFAYHAVEQWDTKERIIYCGLIGFPGGELFGTQKFRVLVEKNGLGTPTLRIELWENGSLVRAGNNINITQATGQIVEFEWDASEITDENLIEIKLFGTAV